MGADGGQPDRKPLRRLHEEEGLAVRRRGRKRATGTREPMPAPAAPGERRSLDLRADVFGPGRRLARHRPRTDGGQWPALAEIDDHTRECPALAADTSISGERVGREPDAVVRLHGRPGAIVSDNGTEFAGRPLDQWAYLNHVELDLSRPGGPSDDGPIEAFVGRLRVECLDARWGLTMADARERIDEWKERYTAELARGPGRVDPAGVGTGS